MQVETENPTPEQVFKHVQETLAGLLAYVQEHGQQQVALHAHIGLFQLEADGQISLDPEKMTFDRFNWAPDFFNFSVVMSTLQKSPMMIPDVVQNINQIIAENNARKSLMLQKPRIIKP